MDSQVDIGFMHRERPCRMSSRTEWRHVSSVRDVLFEVNWESPSCAIQLTSQNHEKAWLMIILGVLVLYIAVGLSHHPNSHWLQASFLLMLNQIGYLVFTSSHLHTGVLCGGEDFPRGILAQTIFRESTSRFSLPSILLFEIDLPENWLACLPGFFLLVSPFPEILLPL